MAFDGFKGCIVAFDHIVAGAAVDVNVDEPGDQDCILEIDDMRGLRNLDALAVTDLADDTVLVNDDPMLNRSMGCRASRARRTVLMQAINEKS